MQAPLRRRTSQLLACALLLCLVFAVVAAIPAPWLVPAGSRGYVYDAC